MRTAFGAEFDVDPGYLNTPSIGVPTRAVSAAVSAAVDTWAHGRAAPADFDADVATAREAFAALVGARPGSVAVGGGVSPLMGTVAASLPAGTRVLTAEREFTSLTFPFAAQGHDVVECPLDELAGRAADHDVVAVSVVASADGALADLAALRAVTDDCLVVLDATQSLGWLPADLAFADAVVAASYKWLLAPRGAAWMALSDRLADRTTPVAAGWYAGGWDAVYGLPLRLHPDARRFDSSPAWLAHVGAAVSMPWLASLDREAVRAHDVGLANRLREGLGMPAGDSAIVSVRRDGAVELLAAAGIRAAVRDGALRLGFHLHNTVEDVDLALDLLTR